MSHSEENIACPNCGSVATGNFCAQCGQETHLHKETFWGLVIHFIGHYFHYDSKFWQTLKALLFSPGKLTIAYMNKQRMRYIPPISLYIFISAVYFLISFSMKEDKIKHIGENTQRSRTDSVNAVKSKLHAALDDAYSVPAHINLQNEDTSTSAFERFIEKKQKSIAAEHGDANKYVLEKTIHNFPKIFFFMIPVMAVFLKILFFRRKSFYFVEHAIFSLHYHCFWFTIFILDFINIHGVYYAVLIGSLLLFAFSYMIVAMKRVYEIGYLRAIFNSISIAIGYSISFAIFFLLNYLLVTAIA